MNAIHQSRTRSAPNIEFICPILMKQVDKSPPAQHHQKMISPLPNVVTPPGKTTAGGRSSVTMKNPRTGNNLRSLAGKAAKALALLENDERSDADNLGGGGDVDVSKNERMSNTLDLLTDSERLVEDDFGGNPVPKKTLNIVEDCDDDDESVQSIERIMHCRSASFASANNRRMTGRWDNNLMEDSMPGLVSFCHGSFASIASEPGGAGTTISGGNGSSLVSNSDDSVSSLECSLVTSQHSKRQHPQEEPQEEQQSIGIGVLMESESIHSSLAQEPPQPHQATALTTTCTRGVEMMPPSSCNANNVLQPLARVASANAGNKHQQVRWGGGELHCSSDTLPTFTRRQSRGDEER